MTNKPLTPKREQELRDGRVLWSTSVTYELLAALDAARAEVARLEAELARTPVRLTAEEAEKVRALADHSYKCEGWYACTCAIALLAPAGKDGQEDGKYGDFRDGVSQGWLGP